VPWTPLLLAIAASALGCGSGTEPDQVSLAQEFTLAPGHSAHVQGEDLTVVFDQVASDSRCPANVTCVWEGDAAVLLTLTQPPRDRAAVELHTSPRFPQKIRYGDLEVALRALDPEPREGIAIAQTAYRATLRVTR